MTPLPMRYAVAGKIVEWEAENALAPEDVLAVWEAINADSLVPNGVGILADARRGAFDAKHSEVKHLAGVLRYILPKAKAYALVATPGSLPFGLGNQFCSYSESEGGPVVAIFGDPDAARAWLKERMR